MRPTTVKMAGNIDQGGKYVKGIEDLLPNTQYLRNEHKMKVVEDIRDNWLTLSQNGKFHALFATHSIPEAIEYYRLMKGLMPALKTTALFDPNIDNKAGVIYKEEGLIEIMKDYNLRYEQDFTLASHGKFKKDISARLAHKNPYLRIENNPEKQLDLLIVVDQMLTGFDSKWVNTLYLDKVLKYENIIQAFSRTNRLFGPDKPFGTIRYYRKPHTMEQYIEKAVKLYSGDRPLGLFVQKLESNLTKLISVYEEIDELFINADIPDFNKLPDDLSERGKFAKLFKEFNEYLEAAKIQGFKWNRSQYIFGKGKNQTAIVVPFSEDQYLVLALRYKELSTGGGGGSTTGGDIPFEIVGHLTEIDTGVIDTNYMNSRFTKYLKTLKQEGADSEQFLNALEELHKSFAYLTHEEQKYANIFLNDVYRGDVIVNPENTLRDYITQYQTNAKNTEIHKFALLFGLDEDKLRYMMNSKITEANINEYGRFDDLKETIDKDKAKKYFEEIEGKPIPQFRVNIKAQNLLREFLISGGFEID
jgi:type I restriction enzyme R subunit